MMFSTLLAMGQAPQPGQPQPPGWLQFGIFIPMIVMFYFVLIRPQQKKAKEQAALIKSVESGDKILTTGGIIATIITVKDTAITIRSADSKFEITKTAIAEIIERNGAVSKS